jgi:predicted transcriptional regulator
LELDCTIDVVKYRSRTDIAADILEIAMDGAIKTKIMYKAFLSFPQLKEYLTVLLERGLLEHVEDENEYRTTDKGKQFLKMYKEVGQIMFPRAKKAR